MVWSPGWSLISWSSLDYPKKILSIFFIMLNKQKILFKKCWKWIRVIFSYKKHGLKKSSIYFFLQKIFKYDNMRKIAEKGKGIIKIWTQKAQFSRVILRNPITISEAGGVFLHKFLQIKTWINFLMEFKRLKFIEINKNSLID